MMNICVSIQRSVCVQQRVLFVCAVWKPKTMNVSQLGSNLHVVFEQAPSSFAFTLYYIYYKLRQDGPFKLQRCKPVSVHGASKWKPSPARSVLAACFGQMSDNKFSAFVSGHNVPLSFCLVFSLLPKEMQPLLVQRRTC